MASFAEQIKSLSCPKPINFDPEEDDFDTTRATLVHKGDQDKEEYQSIDSSALRKKTISLLSDEDKKYQGRLVSRSDLAIMRGDFVDSDESLDELDIEDESEEGKRTNTESDRNENEEHFQDEHSNIEDIADKSDSSDDDDDDTDDSHDDDEGGDMLSNTLGDAEVQNTGISSFSASKTENEIEKGKAVKHQLNLWDTFLEYRIRLQKTMLLVNKLPQYDTTEAFSGNGTMKPETLQGKKAITELLYKLLIIQEKLLDQNPETRKTLYPGLQNGRKNGNVDDEEIQSDSENEENEQEAETIQPNEENSLKLPLKRKGNFTQEEFSECITKRHISFHDIRDSIISKWSEKTRFASTKVDKKSFSAFDRSTMSQIKQVLSDKKRLVKRSQLKRSSYRVLGKCEKEKIENSETEEEANAHLKDYDTEIFDDDDFYHQLLRELIERRTTSNSDDPIEMGRQWLELQKLRRKIKKKVDTRASKGRKLRYNVLSKLVSYMPPIERGSMPDSSRNELFSSLFGQSKVQEEVCDVDVFR